MARCASFGRAPHRCPCCTFVLHGLKLTTPSEDPSELLKGVQPRSSPRAGEGPLLARQQDLTAGRRTRPGTRHPCSRRLTHYDGVAGLLRRPGVVSGLGPKPKPLAWTATAESILTKVRRGRVVFSQTISQCRDTNRWLRCSGGHSASRGPIVRSCHTEVIRSWPPTKSISVEARLPTLNH